MEQAKEPVPPTEKLEQIETIEKEQKPDNNLTISTKLSTEQLICKTPQESPNASVKSLRNEALATKKTKTCSNFTSLLYLGTMQVLFGLLMAVFGVLVIVHDASLAQIGGGLWGGCLAVATGTTGVLAAARDWCPLRVTAQKIAHTIFLALSLISLAVSQLVLVLAATGLARDINLTKSGEFEANPSAESHISITGIPSNYLALLSNIGLLVVAAIECICAAVASYQSSRVLCPCFRRQDDMPQGQQLTINTKNAFVHSWLGKHNPQQPLYIVTSSTNTGRRSKLSGSYPIPPVLAVPPAMMAPPGMVGYPLIPAPLGPIPSPLIHPRPQKKRRNCAKYPRDPHVHRPSPPQEKPRKARSKSKEKVVTTEEVARTYTGLDRVIAEEFIEICDSRNNSLCSDSSCQSSCQESGCHACQSGCTGCTSICNTNSDIASREYLSEKL